MAGRQTLGITRTMRRILTTLILVVAIISGCSTDSHDKKIRDFVKAHCELYPEAHLQDLYKAFFQAEFGAEHIVSDTTSSGRYLDRELTVPDRSSILYEPIGADSTFYRVHLRAVQEGLISRQQLFDAFIGGVHAVEIPQIESWRSTWPHILSVIDRMHLDLPGYDAEKSAIDSLLLSGQYATHHSEEFSNAYDPHYRIVRRDIFERDLLPQLK